MLVLNLVAENAIYTPEGVNVGCVELPDFETALEYYNIKVIEAKDEQED